MTGRDPFVCFVGIAPTIGDAAIGQSILDGLRSRVGLPVRIHADKPRVFAALPGVDALADVRPRIPSIQPPGRSPALPLRLRHLLRDLRETGGGRLLPAATYDALRDALEGCAAVVFQGGPAWTDAMVTRRRVLQRWLFLEAARYYRAPVYHVGVGCGPFAWTYPERLWMPALCRRALDRYERLFVRDRSSKPALDRLGVRARVCESTDAAVFLAPRRDAAFEPVERRILAGAPRPRVVVCVRDYQPTYPQARAARDAALAALAATLDRVQEGLADVFFLSTDYLPRPEKQSDLEIARRVQQTMTTPGSVLIETEVAHPAALKHLYGRFDAMITMRLHPAVLALDHGVPALLLSYDPKCDDFMARLGLDEYVVPLARFDAAAALDRLHRMLGTPGLRAEIRARYAALKAAHAADYDPMYAQIRSRAEELHACA